MDETRISPDNQPAPADPSSGRNGAVPSSSNGGPSGSGGTARGGSVPRVSLLWSYNASKNRPGQPLLSIKYTSGKLQHLFEREAAEDKTHWIEARHAEDNRWPPQHSLCGACGGVFNTRPWAPDRKTGCERCGADRRWAESPSNRDFVQHYVNKGGAPKRGIHEPDQVRREIATVLRGNELLRAHMAAQIERWKKGEPVRQKDLRAPIEIAYYLAANVNAEALASVTPWEKRKINRMRQRGKKLSQNPSYNEHEGIHHVNAVQLDRIEAKLDDVLERLPSQPDKIEPDDGKKHLRLVADDESEVA